MPTSHDHPRVDTAPSATGISRRTVLRSGGLTALTAVFLAACGKEHEQLGRSGPAPSTTAVAPSVPATEPTESTLAEGVVQRSTLSSIELLVAKVYDDQGPKLGDTKLMDAAERFATDHRDAAKAIQGLGEVNDDADKPNEFLATELVDPKLGELTNPEAIREFMADLESSLVATYLNSLGILIDMDQRRTVMAYGAAAARRVGALRPGTGGADGEAFYSLLDLVPADAFVRGPEEAAS